MHTGQSLQTHQKRNQHLTLPQKVDAHIRALHRWANRLDQWYYSCDRSGKYNEARHYRIQQSRKTLRLVVRQLRLMRRQQSSDYALYRAISEYLECLMTSVEDAQEDCARASKRRWPAIECWKAKGEAHILPRICAKLARLVQNHEPEENGCLLSPDGKAVISFPSDENKPTAVAPERIPFLSNHHRFPTKRHPKPCNVDGRSSTTLLTTQRKVNEPMKVPPLGPFPLLPEPDLLSAYQQDALAQIEQGLASHPRLLLTLARRPQEAENMGVFLACVDRLLSYTPVTRVLVVTATVSLKEELVQMYRQWVSCEDETLLIQQYPLHTRPTGEINARVCILSLREAQLAARTLPRDTFDALLIYGYPVVSSIWTQTLDHFTAPYRIGFSPGVDEELLALFDGHATFVASPEDGAAGGNPPLLRTPVPLDRLSGESGLGAPFVWGSWAGSQSDAPSSRPFPRRSALHVIENPTGQEER